MPAWIALRLDACLHRVILAKHTVQSPVVMHCADSPLVLSDFQFVWPLVVAANDNGRIDHA
jgi:hypothetical protein